MDDARLTELMELYLEGEISTADEAELAKHLDQAPSARATLRQLLAVDCHLLEAFDPERAGPAFWRGLRERIRVAEEGRSFRTKVVERLRKGTTRRLHAPQTKRTWKITGLRVAAAAAIVAVLVAGIFYAQLPPAPEPQQIARAVTLVEFEGQVLVAGAPATAGAQLVAGQGVMVSGPGKAVLTFADGTRVAMGAETEIRDIREADQDRGKRLFVAVGRVRSEIAKQPKDLSMVFVTPYGEAKVLGTKLDIAVDVDATKGAMELRVEEGAVLVTRTSDQKTVEVAGGQYTLCAAGVDLVSRPGQTLPAFPGAEGFGSDTPGGRGGRILEVTNLNEDGPGSFRAACEASGPRLIVFRVGGTIALTRDIELKDPYVTIAGQTAPGDGICIRGKAFRIGTHDVIVRGLRLRIGDDHAAGNLNHRDGLEAANERVAPFNIVIDHCSVSWAVDENMTLWYPCRDITVQWCITSEGLQRGTNPDSRRVTGLMVGAGAERVSIHHNLLAHTNMSLSLIGAEAECVNNVIYNWKLGSTELTAHEFSPHMINLVGNYYKPGPDATGKEAIYVDPGVLPASKVHLKGNIGPGRLQDAGNEWALASNNAGRGIESATPAARSSGIVTHPAIKARDLVLAHAGATAPRRDPVDVRVVQSVIQGTGRIIESQKDVGGWPAYRNGEAPADSDHDGMSDAWEQSHGLSPHEPGDRNFLAPSGYTWIEEYVNSLFLSGLSE